MYHVLPYFVAAGVNAANTDLAGIADAEFTRRNNHFIFSEQYNLLAAYGGAPSMTQLRLNVPTINGIGRHHIWPINLSATIPDKPNVDDYRDFPMPLPMDEEIALECSNNLGAATENTYGIAFIAPTTWTRTLPRGIQSITLRATGAAANVAQGWSALSAFTFSDNLRGGWYAVTGFSCFCANTLIARLVFARSTMYNGRKLRPGVLCQNAVGNTPWPGFLGGMGEMGRFHSFEPPQFETFANAAGGATQEFRLDVVYLGEGGRPA